MPTAERSESCYGAFCLDLNLGLSMIVSGFTFVRNVVKYDYSVMESIWDETLGKDGLIYTQQTNIALSHDTGDWAFYIQADEVVHEDDLPVIQEAMRRHLGNPEVKGLLFRHLHFIADYSTNACFYHKALRIIRNNGEVESCCDAVGFHLKTTQQYLQSGPKEWIAPSNRRVFYYGWVKDPETMVGKMGASGSLSWRPSNLFATAFSLRTMPC